MTPSFSDNDEEAARTEQLMEYRWEEEYHECRYREKMKKGEAV